MRGCIGILSQRGCGSTFWFTARLEKAKQPESPLLPEETPRAEDRLQLAHAGARILVAEDEPINQEVARDLLETVGLLEIGRASCRERV